MKKMKLSQFAVIQSGLVLNRREARHIEETEKVYNRISLRSLNEYGQIDHKDLDSFPANSIIDEAFLTQPNDIIVKLFTPICPTLITEADRGLVIPSQVAVIRMSNDLVLPEYLCYYLSLSNVSDFMLSIEGWRSQRSIKIGTFAQLEIPIPPINKQRLIAQIVKTNLKINQLYNELIEQENKLTNLKIQNFVGGKL